jgi:CheY-like chemotaxis protein
MRILLVDDNLRHRRAGQRQLTALGHEVIALCDYTEARDRADKQHFDVALIDLLMPAESTTLSPNAIGKHVGVEIAVGFPLMLALTISGIKLIAVATDTNHHHHPASAMVDWFSGEWPMLINGAKAIVLHAPVAEDGCKDWGKVLAQLIAS